jgi:peptide/nickel transport system permease protein
MLEVIRKDYIRTAYAKGLTSQMVYGACFQECHHPPDHLIMLDIPQLFSGALITEQVFAWPGWDACTGNMRYGWITRC